MIFQPFPSLTSLVYSRYSHGEALQYHQEHRILLYHRSYYSLLIIRHIIFCSSIARYPLFLKGIGLPTCFTQNTSSPTFTFLQSGPTAITLAHAIYSSASSISPVSFDLYLLV